MKKIGPSGNKSLPRSRAKCGLSGSVWAGIGFIGVVTVAAVTTALLMPTAAAVTAIVAPAVALLGMVMSACLAF